MTDEPKDPTRRVKQICGAALFAALLSIVGMKADISKKAVTLTARK
jgi:hypothetical protein